MDGLHLAAGEAATLARAALALHHAYCAVESILERIARTVEGDVPTGTRWHRELLDASVLELDGIRPALLSVDSVRGLHDLLAFRHFVRHAYAVALDAERLGELQRRVRDLWPRLHADLVGAVSWLDALGFHEE